MIIASIPMSASALVVDEWEIAISGNEATVIDYNGTCSAKMTMPTQIGGYKVVGLSAPIFSDNVEEIIFPEGFKYIKGRDTFTNLKNKLKKISLPQSLEILESYFNDFTELKEIYISGNIKEILGGVAWHPGQFTGCVNLTTVHLNAGLETISESAFRDCINLKNIEIPNTVKTIDAQAFRNCDSLVSITIPNSVINLGEKGGHRSSYSDAAFIDCDNLESVIVGNGINKFVAGSLSLGEFSNCPSLKSIHFENGLQATILSAAKIGATGVLENNVLLKTIILPEGIKEIGSRFLNNISNLENIVIPKSVNKFNGNPLCGEEEKPLPKLFIYGFAGSEAEKFASSAGFPFVDISIATPANNKVLIDGKEVAFTAYTIGGNNYFKLRDIASALNGTNKNFNVGWDGNNNAITLNSKTSYISVGGELVVNSNATATEPKISNPKIFVDGKLTTFMAFNIANNNYIKLRDLGEAFDFGVDWNNSTQTIEINTNKSYSK